MRMKDGGYDVSPPSERVEEIPGWNVPGNRGTTFRKGTNPNVEEVYRWWDYRYVEGVQLVLAHPSRYLRSRGLK